MGEILDLESFRKDSSELPLTTERGLKLLGLEKWPGNWEVWKEGIFLNGLASIVKRNGAAWVRFHRESILEELERFMTF